MTYTEIIMSIPLDEFVNIINDSNTFKEVANKIKIPNSSTNVHRLRTRTVALNISIDHFYKATDNFNGKYKLTDILCKNSVYTRGLKDRLINEGILINKCAWCGLSDSWNNNPIVLHMDHINGIHDDNRIENLRILCPNCHSQTSTYCGKNVSKKVNSICECGNKKEVKSSHCQKCYGKLNSKFTVYDIDNLVNDIELFGFMHVAEVYGVSDNAIRKRLISHNVDPKLIGKYKRIKKY